jgi:predicted O-methyltransferase YrrM
MESLTKTRIQSLAPSLDPRTLNVLVDMYDGSSLLGTESKTPIPIEKATRIGPEHGATLRQLMIDSSTSRSLEVGFAYGFSTLWMLDALRSKLNGMHIAIDPFEKSAWHGIGLKQVENIQFERKFEWLESASIHALSDLIRQGEKFDFIFIDGNHRFDDVIVDFYLCDQLARPGALIVLDDLWLPSIRAASNFIIKNRNYRIHPQSTGAFTLQKVQDDDRDWRHFEAFLAKNDSPKTWFDRLVRKVVRRMKATKGAFN